MKKLLTFATIIASLGIFHAFAQFGPHGGGQGPHFGGALDKLFGDNQTFSATTEFQADGFIIPGKLNFDTGKSRNEFKVSEMRGARMRPDFIQQIKDTGVDTTIGISRPDLKLNYLVYPGLKCYLESPAQEPSGSINPDDFKMETIELGKETMEGHACVKNKVIITGKDGHKYESAVWNATDLKNFPVKVITYEGTKSATMLYKNISFTKPAASLFDPPSGFTKYDNVQTMMQKIGGDDGQQPAQH